MSIAAVIPLSEYVSVPSSPSIAALAPSPNASGRFNHGSEPSGPAWEAYKAVVRAVGNGGKLLLIHPDIPAQARAALEQGVAVMAKDPAFLKAADTVLEGYGLVTGAELAISGTKSADLAWLRDMLAREFKMSFSEQRGP